MPFVVVVAEVVAIDADHVQKLLSRLPEEQRSVVVLRVWHEMTFREIAEAIDESPDTVASRWRYALGKLKEWL